MKNYTIFTCTISITKIRWKDANILCVTFFQKTLSLTDQFKTISPTKNIVPEHLEIQRKFQILNVKPVACKKSLIPNLIRLYNNS